MKRISILIALIYFVFAGTAQDTLRSIQISPQDPESMQPGIIEAYRAGLKKVVIPSGVYRLPDPDHGPYMIFSDMVDFEIDARGVTLLRSDPTRGCISFNNCRNVRFRGATLLNETPPFTQGTVEGIDSEGNWYEVRIDKGWPANFDDPRTGDPSPRGTIFDPGTRQFKTGTKDCFFNKAERMGPNLFRLFFAEDQQLDPKTHPAVVGDWIAFRGRGATDIAINGCAEMFIDDVTILSGAGFCIHETGGEGGNKYMYTVTYAPAPAGADKPPLMACNADAFHSRNMRRGPVLENCLFEGMQDDGIPIHGSFALVAGGKGGQLIVCGGKNLRTGDPVRFYDTNGSLVGEANITSVARKEEFIPESPITNHRFKRNKDFYQVTIDKELQLGFQFLISNPAANGSGYIIRNNIIRNHRARGMLLKAENGLVEGNLIEGSTIGGIILSPEIWWNEAGFSRNIIIRNNIIRHTGYSTSGSSDHQSGALTISGGGGEPDQIVPVYQDPKVAGLKPGHQNILIENNTIEDCDGVNLMIAVASNVTVKDNKFIRPQQELSHRGQPSGVDPTALIWVFNSENIRFDGNTVMDPGSYSSTMIKVNDRSKNIMGIKNGVTVSKWFAMQI